MRFSSTHWFELAQQFTQTGPLEGSRRVESVETSREGHMTLVHDAFSERSEGSLGRDIVQRLKERLRKPLHMIGLWGKGK